MSKVDVEDTTVFVPSEAFLVTILIVPPLLCLTRPSVVFDWLRENGLLSLRGQESCVSNKVIVYSLVLRVVTLGYRNPCS